MFRIVFRNITCSLCVEKKMFLSEDANQFWFLESSSFDMQVDDSDGTLNATIQMAIHNNSVLKHCGNCLKIFTRRNNRHSKIWKHEDESWNADKFLQLISCSRKCLLTVKADLRICRKHTLEVVDVSEVELRKYANLSKTHT